jgi:hypothetical protein
MWRLHSEMYMTSFRKFVSMSGLQYFVAASLVVYDNSLSSGTHPPSHTRTLLHNLWWVLCSSWGEGGGTRVKLRGAQGGLGLTGAVGAECGRGKGRGRVGPPYSCTVPRACGGRELLHCSRAWGTFPASWRPLLHCWDPSA